MTQLGVSISIEEGKILLPASLGGRFRDRPPRFGLCGCPMFWWKSERVHAADLKIAFDRYNIIHEQELLRACPIRC